MKRTCRKRKKAFIGAIIGAVTSIAGSAIGAAAQKKAQNKQIARENEINRNQSANNLSAAYSNEEYVDDFLNKTTFKYGGNKTMTELPKTKLARKLYVNPKYITKNTAKTPAQNLPKTKLAVKRDASVASNITRNTTQKPTKKSVQTSKANNNRNTNTNTNTTSNAIKNEVKNAGRYITAGALDMAGGFAFGPRNLARTYVKDMANIIVGGYKHFTKTSAQKPSQKTAQKPTQTDKTVAKKDTNKTYTTSKNFGKRVNRVLINTGIDLAGGPIVFPQRTGEKIARTYLNYMTNLIVNGHGKNPVKNSTQKTKSASPVTQTRTAVRRNANTASTATRANTNAAKGSARQNTTNKTNTSAKTNTTTNRPAQRTAQRTTNASAQRPAKPVVQKTTKPSNTKTKINNTTATKTNSQHTRQTTDNKLTFSRAFANARKAGQQTFNYNGKSYTTQLAGEKKNNTNKIYNTATLNTKGVDVTETTKLPINTKTNTISSASSVIPKSNTLNIADNNGYYDRLKMMKCGGKRKMKCGGKCKSK